MESGKANEYPGLPYPKQAGISVDERGTLAQLYQNINDDIEQALPLLNDSYLAVPKYHSTPRRHMLSQQDSTCTISIMTKP